MRWMELQCQAAPGGAIKSCCLESMASNKAFPSRVSLVSKAWSQNLSDTIMAKDAEEMEEELAPDQEIDFCTMGMFIVGKCLFLSCPA